jgi:hypothetical protein
MDKTMPTGRKIRVRIYKSITSEKYKIILPGIELVVTPQMVHSNGEVIAVGTTATSLYWAIMLRNKNTLRSMLPTLLEVTKLLSIKNIA